MPIFFSVTSMEMEASVAQGDTSIFTPITSLKTDTWRERSKGRWAEGGEQRDRVDAVARGVWFVVRNTCVRYSARTTYTRTAQARKQRKHASNASTQSCKHLAVDDKAEPVHDACALFGEVALDEVAERFSVGGRGAMRHDDGEEEVMGCAHGCGWGTVVVLSVCGAERSGAKR